LQNIIIIIYNNNIYIMSINHLLLEPELEIFAKKVTADEIDTSKIVSSQLEINSLVADNVYVTTNNGGGPAYRIDQSSQPWVLDASSVEWQISGTVLPTPVAGPYYFTPAVGTSFGIFARSGNKASISGNFKIQRRPDVAEAGDGKNEIQFIIPQLEGADPSSVAAKFEMTSTSSNGYSYEMYESPTIGGANVPGGSPTYVSLYTQWTKASGYVPAGTATPPGPEIYLVSVEISWLESIVNPPVPP
jgi:hypothetical protein